MTAILKLDCDNPDVEPACIRVQQVLRLAGLASRVTMTRLDRTRRGWHIRVYLTGTMAPMAIVALQAIAGSDWRRETHNWRRVRQWRHLSPESRERFNVLYARHWRGLTVA